MDAQTYRNLKDMFVRLLSEVDAADEARKYWAGMAEASRGNHLLALELRQELQEHGRDLASGCFREILQDFLVAYFMVMTKDDGKRAALEFIEAQGPDEVTRVATEAMAETGVIDKFLAELSQQSGLDLSPVPADTRRTA